MIEIGVLSLFFLLYGLFIINAYNSRYLWVLFCIIFFPPCVYFMQNPQVSPLHLFLYSFFVIEFTKNFCSFKNAFLKFPLRYVVFLLLGSLILSAYMSGDGLKGYYNAGRYFMENYAYLFLAFFAGLSYKYSVIWGKFFYAILILFLIGFVEFLFGDNLFFKFLCKAFPYYDGFYDLHGIVSASRSYRTRIFASTMHPTTLGSILCCLLLFFAGIVKEFKWKKYKTYILFAALIILLFMCNSRTALVCTMLGGLMFLFQKVKLKSKLFIVVLVCTFGFLSIQKVIESFSIENQGSSLSLRQEQLFFSLIQFSQSPIWGNGIRYTSKFIMERDVYNDRVIDDEIGGLESILFYQLIDYGFIGLFFYCLLFLVCFIFFFRRRKFSYAQSGMLVTGMFFLYALLSGEIGGNNIFAYMLIGYCMGATRANEEEKELIKEGV